MKGSYFALIQQRVRRLGLFLLFIIGLNACSLLFFRFFITLDGPMHVLHACVVKAALFGERYHTAFADYVINRGTLDFSDLVLIPLTHWLSPPMAHAAYAVIVLLSLGTGCWWCARGLEVNSPGLLVWILPLSFSYVLILGFFTFLLSAGCSLMLAGWWIGHARIRWRTLLVGSLGVLGCQGIHRAGGTLAMLFICCHEATLLLEDRSAWRTRWAGVPGSWRAVGLGAGALAALWKLWAVLSAEPFVRLGHEQDRWQEIFTGRPLLLFAEAPERPMLLLIGGLFIVTLLLALVCRGMRGRTPLRADGLGVAALVLLLASAMLHTPNAQFLYLSTRAQTVALLPLAVWMSAVIPRTGYTNLLAGAIMASHIWRMTYAEHVMADARAACDQSMAVIEHLPLHGVTMPVVRDDNWLLEHLSAFPAAAYQGIFLSPCHHLGFVHREGENWQLRDYYDGYQRELRWLEDHVNTRTPPVIDHIVIFGHGRPFDARWRNLYGVLGRHYMLQWRNDYAEVWALNDDR